MQFILKEVAERNNGLDGSSREVGYRGSTTYAVFTTTDPTTAMFGLCTRKWGIFVLVGDLLQSH